MIFSVKSRDDWFASDRCGKSNPPTKLKTAEAIASAAFCSPQNEFTMARAFPCGKGFFQKKSKKWNPLPVTEFHIPVSDVQEVFPAFVRVC